MGLVIVTTGMPVAALAVPTAFLESGLIFACAYAVVRFSQIGLFVLASRGDPGLRSSVMGLAVSTAIGVGILVVASFTDGYLQGALWALALLLDMGGPYVFGSEGWRLVPGHFAERHGLIIIIALGESIVSIGVGAEVVKLDGGVITASVLGLVVAAALWWAYFAVVALVAERRLTNAAPGRERPEIARDSFSYLHLPMVAGQALIPVTPAQRLVLHVALAEAQRQRGLFQVSSQVTGVAGVALERHLVKDGLRDGALAAYVKAVSRADFIKRFAQIVAVFSFDKTLELRSLLRGNRACLKGIFQRMPAAPVEDAAHKDCVCYRQGAPDSFGVAVRDPG
mgnify:CR=1 FL=1